MDCPDWNTQPAFRLPVWVCANMQISFSFSLIMAKEICLFRFLGEAGASYALALSHPSHSSEFPDQLAGKHKIKDSICLVDRG